MDAHPINTLVRWLGDEAGSISLCESPDMERSMAELSELKARIAAGEYRLDASAIAEAMFGAADRAMPPSLRSEVFEAREFDDAPGRVDDF